ncbi:hypothetical protein FRC10_008067 [Ceratobasidium sp. 414]|nr:hypothetical protein FRC10_008067 [Ceratobasidium sp. 414]
MKEVQPDQAAQAIFNLVQGACSNFCHQLRKLSGASPNQIHNPLGNFFVRPGRPAGLVGRSSGYIENLPPGTKRGISRYATLEAQMKYEMLELEKKYLALYTPLFQRRHAILSGESEPTDEEVTLGEAVTAKNKEDGDEEEKELVASLAKLTAIKDKMLDAKKSEDDDSKGVPQFWPAALRNHPQLQTPVTEWGEEALAYTYPMLISSPRLRRTKSLPRLSYLANPDLGFKLTFVFDGTPYFENEELGESYFYQVGHLTSLRIPALMWYMRTERAQLQRRIHVQRAKDTEIKWKEDKDLTKTVEIKKQRNKSLFYRTIHAHTFTLPVFRHQLNLSHT